MAQVDVLIPTFNRADFLPECLWSLCRQSHRDFRVLIWDDGSTDSSTERKNLPDDDRIVVLNRGGTNQGIPAARNALLAQVQAPFFCWQDSDDVAHHERLEKLLGFLDRHKSFAGVFSPLFFFNGSWSRKHWHRYDVDTTQWHTPAAGIPHETPGAFGLWNNFTFASSLYRSALAATQFNLSKPMAEDYDWMRRLLLAGHRFGHVKEGLYYARRHPKRTTVLIQERRKRQRDAKAASE